MKEIIAKEIVSKIASEVFRYQLFHEVSIDGTLGPTPARTDEEILECAQRVIEMSTVALRDL